MENAVSERAIVSSSAYLPYSHATPVSATRAPTPYRPRRNLSGSGIELAVVVQGKSGGIECPQQRPHRAEQRYGLGQCIGDHAGLRSDRDAPAQTRLAVLPDVV